LPIQVQAATSAQKAKPIDNLSLSFFLELKRYFPELQITANFMVARL
jgi:hypothetical protein